MTTGVITPAEAWEEIERLKATVAYGFIHERWYVTVHRPRVVVAVGATAMEAITQLLGLIAEEATKAEAANA
jgi:uracil-DNA glycosylase